MSELFDESEVRKTLSVMLEPGAVFEVRVVNGQLKGSYGGPATVAGYFGNPDDCIRELEKLASAEGFYVTMNPINPALLARCANRLKKSASGGLTKDPHVLRRLHFLIDLDPKRLSGISATDEEKNKALEKSRQVYGFLKARGWPEPIVADSGNGYHLLYFIDLPRDDGGLLEKLLGALAERFNGDGVELDRTVHNPSRITKLYGTMAAKGDSTEDRPHRLSKILVVPGRNGVVTPEQLQSLAEELKPAEPPPAVPPLRDDRGTAHNSWDMEAFLAKHGAAYSKRDTLPTGETRWRLKQCPFDPDHVSPDAAVFQMPDGVLGFRCFHDSCVGKQWHDFRRRFEPDYDPDLWAPASKVTVTNEPREPRELPPRPPPYVPPPLDLFPREVKRFLRSGATTLDVDPAFFVLPLLSGAAAMIGNSRCLRLKEDYLAPSIIWTVNIAPTGDGKSPGQDAATAPLLLRERELIRENKKATAKFTKELADWEARSREDRVGKVKPAQSPRLTCWMDDTTIEAVALRLNDNPRGVAVVKDEFSHWWESMDQYHDRNGSDVSRWLSIWNGKLFALDRATGGRSYRIPAPRVSIAGGAVPEKFQDLLTDDFFVRGLPARFLMSMPTRNRPREWVDEDIPKEVKKAVYDLFEELWALQPLKNENDEEYPSLLGLSKEAKEVFVAFHNECSRRAFEANFREKAQWLKVSAYSARLALVGQLMWDLKATEVSGRVMQAAVDLARWFGNEAERIFAVMAETPEQRDRRKLVEFIERRGGDVTVRDVTHYCWSYKGKTEKAERDLDALVKIGLGQWQEKRPEGSGRPTRILHLTRTSPSPKRNATLGESDNYGDGDAESIQKNEVSGSPVDGAVTGEVNATASLPVMITKRMEAELQAMGYSQADIDKMTPAQANDILAKEAPSGVSGGPKITPSVEPITEPAPDFVLQQEIEAPPDPTVPGDLQL